MCKNSERPGQNLKNCIQSVVSRILFQGELLVDHLRKQSSFGMNKENGTGRHWKILKNLLLIIQSRNTKRNPEPFVLVQSLARKVQRNYHN